MSETSLEKNLKIAFDILRQQEYVANNRVDFSAQSFVLNEQQAGRSTDGYRVVSFTKAESDRFHSVAVIAPRHDGENYLILGVSAQLYCLITSPSGTQNLPIVTLQDFVDKIGTESVEDFFAGVLRNNPPYRFIAPAAQAG